MVGQGHLCKQIKFFGRNYLPSINRGTNLNNKSLLTSMTVYFESCVTGDTSSSIVINRGQQLTGFNVDIGTEKFGYYSPVLF